MARPSHKELDRSIVSGLVWTGGARGVTQFIQWAALLLVVRLLTPADFGLVAMATAYLGLVGMFSEFGLGAAIVQRRDLTESQIARLGGVSLIACVLLAALSIAVSGLVAGFFQEPRVRLIVIVLSIDFLFTGLDVLPRSLLKRDFAFKRLALVQASQNLTYSATSLAFAAFGLGYWSLVFGALLGGFARMLTAVGLRRHAISWPRDFESIKSELSFGIHVVVSQLALYVRKFSDVLVVGRFLGTEALGAYNVGWTQANVAVDRVVTLMSQVSPPVLAAAQADKVALRRYTRIFAEGVTFLTFPTTFGLAVVGDDFVRLAFGDQWLATIGPLRVLAVLAALRAITPILSQVLIATDHSKENMQFAVTAAMVLPVFLIAGSHWGILGVAVGWLIGQPIVTGAMLVPRALRAADMRLGEFFGALRPAGVASIVMVIAVIVVRWAMPDQWPLVVRFAVEVSTGAVVYLSWIFSMHRSRFGTIVSLLRSGRQEAGVALEAPADAGTPAT